MDVCQNGLQWVKETKKIFERIRHEVEGLGSKRSGSSARNWQKV